MDPVSVTLVQRLQAVLLRKQLQNHLSKIFQRHQNRTGEIRNDDSDLEERQLGHGNSAVVETSGSSAAESDALVEDDEISVDPLDSVLQDDDASQFHPFDEQAIRDAEYITFEIDDPEDHTAGPSRFVLASDGIKQCVALLFTPQLSVLVQEMVLNQRQYLQEERQAKQQIKLIQQFQRKIKRELTSHKVRMRFAENPSDAGILIPQGDTANLQAEVEVLERMWSNMADRKTALEGILRIRQQYHREKQQQVTAILDEAFVNAAIVSPEEEEELPVEEFDLQEQYKLTFKEMWEPEPQILGGYSPEPSEVDVNRDDMQEYEQEQELQQEQDDVPELDVSRDYMHQHVPKPIPEEETEALAKREAQWALDDAFANLEIYQDQFDNGEQSREDGLQQCIKSQETGEDTPYNSQLEFDLSWVQNFAEITRNLIQAEKTVEEAKKAVKAVGLVYYSRYWVSSDYADRSPRPGYPLSREIDSEQAQQSTVPLVEDWLEKMEAVDVGEEVDADLVAGDKELEIQNSAENAGADEWECREVEMGDSLSCVDLDFHREQIDMWQRMLEDSN